jgi:hypothetical protein
MTRRTYPQNEVDLTLEKFAAGAAKQANKSHRVWPKVATESTNEGHLSMSKGNALSTTTDAVPSRMLVAVDFSQ